MRTPRLLASPAVEIEIDGLPEGYDENQVADAAARLAEIAPDHDRVRLHITTDLQAAVRSKHPDRGYAEAFEQDRPMGHVSAKTIEQPDGTVDVTMDCRMFAPGAGADPIRTLEHEGLHVALDQREESLQELHARGDGAGHARATYAQIAGIACDEYRVERALLSRHEPEASSQLAGFGETLQTFEASLQSAVDLWRQDEDVGAFSRGVGSPFSQAATISAYVIAEYDAAGRKQLKPDKRLAARLLGTHWVDFADTLLRLPPADTETGRASLDAIANAAADQLQEWLGHIGFVWTDEPGGGIGFYMLPGHDW
jgi:hypothetical protein